MSDRPLYLGIDLGTTNSSAALFDGERVTLVRNAEGTTLTPSVVRLDARGNVTVGARARRLADRDPENVRAEFKRLMGTARAIEFPAARLSRKPEELAALVLRALRADVKDQAGFEPERAIVSVPALFELPQAAATSEAARLAGFAQVELIQEPIASALAAGWRATQAEGRWLVYDLGGGTFDVSLLETKDELLRVVAHDGDNFLGGRDVDQAIVEWAVGELESAAGARIDRADPRHQSGLRRLRLAAEEAKIDLSRAASTPLALAQVFTLGDRDLDLDVTLDRPTLERLAAPLVERTLAICRRLLAAHGSGSRPLERIVLVGGPTLMPQLRERVCAALGAPPGSGLDPMTLVAEGAAIYAATAGLDARPRPTLPAPASARHKVWLQYPAMCADLTPHVVGRSVERTAAEGPAQVRLVRDDGGWESALARLDGEGAFVLSARLQPHRPNVFHIEAVAADGSPVAVEPETITIVQGLTVTDPPLSRTIGVALANDRVKTYFERGAPLPAKRTFVHHTVATVARNVSGSLLRIPIVQGEFEAAHLCRLVGTLEIDGAAIESSLPAGTPVELTLEVDRGGRLHARALIPSLRQVFERVDRLVVPDVSADGLEEHAGALKRRLELARAAAFKNAMPQVVIETADLDRDLAEIARLAALARGGDQDSAQKAQKLVLELDARLAEIETGLAWPELEQESREAYAWALGWTSEYGSPPEQRLLEEAGATLDRARREKDSATLQRQLRLVRQLGNASFHRNPRAVELLFDHYASEVASATDLPRAQALVKAGRQAIAKNDRPGLRGVVDELVGLLPADATSRALSFDSGLR